MLRALLAERGAAFTADLQRLSGLDQAADHTALWELATAGLASADGFDQLRAHDGPSPQICALPHRRPPPACASAPPRAPRQGDGRCSVSLAQRTGTVGAALRGASASASARSPAHIAAAKRADAALEAHARILLCRYGVLFRELLARESNAPKWRDLAPVLRRLEARGEIRGGRFVTVHSANSSRCPRRWTVFAARVAIRGSHRRAGITVAAADPLNLAGILVPGERTPSIPGREVRYQNGSLVNEESPAQQAPAARKSRSIPDLLRSQTLPASALRATAAAAQTSATRGCFHERPCSPPTPAEGEALLSDEPLGPKISTWTALTWYLPPRTICAAATAATPTAGIVPTNSREAGKERDH